MRPATDALSDLYLADETAWLDAHAEMIREGRYGEIDYPNLQEFLESMARRDRREVKSRLTVLLAHLLKWDHQPGFRSASWWNTIRHQRGKLVEHLDTQTLRNHADEVLPLAYKHAVLKALAETGLAEEAFPKECPYTVEHLLTAELPEGGALP